MKGFTLVEVLVSLFILSLVAVTGITSISYSTKTISSLSDDFYRATLAENIIIKSYFEFDTIFFYDLRFLIFF